jgi:cytidylate kinase
MNVIFFCGVTVAVITISRQAGSGGDEVAAHLTSLLQFHLVRRSYLEKAIYEYCLVKTIRQLPLPEIIPPAVQKPGSRIVHRQLLKAVLLNLAARENMILTGYGGQFVFQRFRSAFHVRIVASFDNRARRLASSQGITREGAADRIRQKDMERRAFLKDFFRAEWGKQRYYDMILNMNRLSPTKGAEVIASAFMAVVDTEGDTTEEYQRYMMGQGIEKIDLVPDQYQDGELFSKTAFAHPSEEEFASVLNFYRIKWEYEPRSFPIEWDDNGQVSESFTPDFYLPEFDTYIELTTMKQDLVTRKNRKVRKFRELNPDINLKVFYGRDYKELLGKYGID